ncbi:hypothetical protein GQ53DRAFT_729186 [Thozetella sp. PMI_491]|nr:hypothetical protein GQ53DRAFT_729186 [Thozetella sp. PMI_491]
MSEDLDGSRKDYESPPTTGANKRKRTTRACNPCRTRKHKCDGRQPTCSSCSMSELPCTYGSGSKKRGLPTGYVRSLELLWAIVFAVVPNARKVVKDLLTEIKFALDPGGKLMVLTSAFGSAEALRKAWADSGLQRELESRLSQMVATMDTNVVNMDQSNNLVPNRDHNVLFDQPLRYSAEQHTRGSQLSPPRWSQQHESLKASSRLSDYNVGREETIPGCLPQGSRLPAFPRNSRRLLELYFSYTHCWIPMVEKHKMFEVLYSMSRAPVFVAGELSTFWAILAHSSVRYLEGPQNTTVAAAAVTADLHMTADQLYAQARKLIPTEEETTHLGHSRALLILALFQIHRGGILASWHLIGRAVRIALAQHNYALGGAESNALATGSDQYKTHTLFGCFTLDALTSCYLGRPPHMRTADIRHISKPAETGPDEWEPQAETSSEPMRAISIFNHYVDVIRILNDGIWETTYGSQDELCAKQLSSLRLLFNHTPQHCMLPALGDQDSIAGSENFSLPLINLHLAFQSTLAILRRKYGSAPQSPLSRGTFLATPVGPSMLRLLSLTRVRFGDAAIPAVFTIYMSLGDRRHSPGPSSPFNTQLGQANTLSVPIPPSPIRPRESCENVPTNSTEDVMSIVTETESIVASTSGRLLPVSFRQSSISSAMHTGETSLIQFPFDHGASQPTDDEFLQEYSDPQGARDFTFTDQTDFGEFGVSDHIEWGPTQSLEFWQNLGFTGSAPVSSHPSPNA